tara:strand:+ start:2285 stop:2656 length:372 start_codon:yes stop_codon:yes gene_type:complete
MDIVKKDGKEQFIENIKTWVLVDSKLKLVNEKIKEMREKKNFLLNQINDYVYDNNMKDTKIEITDGELVFCERKEYAPLTYKYVEECLQNIIKDEKHIEYILNYIKNNRKIKLVNDIKRNLSK